VRSAENYLEVVLTAVPGAVTTIPNGVPSLTVPIFLVDEDAPRLQAMARSLDGLGPVRCLAPDDAVDVVAGAGACVVCLGPDPGPGVVRCLAQAAPDCARLAWVEDPSLDQIQRLLNEGGVTRVFAWPAEDEPMRRCVLECLERLDRSARSERIFAGFRSQLSILESLTTLAGTTADALFELLEGRALMVQLWDQDGLSADGVRLAGDPGRHWVEATRGGEMSTDLQNIPLFDGKRSVGEIVIDRGSSVSEAVDAHGYLGQIEPFATTLAIAAAARIRRREVDRSIHGLLVAVAGLAGCREHVGSRHVERIGGFVRLLAVGLREDGHFVDELSDQGIDDMVHAVALHDIGKLSVPDAILLKPGQLTSQERQVIETHARAGALALEEALKAGVAPHFMELARDAARDHHEKWDGSGYPRGLAGDHIPLVARLLALADVYDALTTRRPYRDAWSHARAVQFMAERSGSHFDPRVLESFLARASATDALRDRLRDEDPESDARWLAA